MLAPDAPITKAIVDAAEAKNLGYEKLGMHSMEVAFVKAIDSGKHY